MRFITPGAVDFPLPGEGLTSVVGAAVEHHFGYEDHMPGDPIDPIDAAGMGERPVTPDAVTILLVEDNEDNRTVYTTILRYYGYQVIEAPSAEEGIAIARQAQPALILMDIGLPGIDGWEATRRLKGDARTRHIPIVALTAHALAEHRAQSFAAGCDGYLAKPIEPRDVLAEVRRYLLGTDRVTA